MPEKKHFRRTHFPDKFLKVIPIVRAERERICNECSHLTSDKFCGINAKFIPTVIMDKVTRCPLGQWGSNYDS